MVRITLEKEVLGVNVPRNIEVPRETGVGGAAPFLNNGRKVLGYLALVYGHGPMHHPPGGLLAGARELPFSLILWPDEFRQPSSNIPNVSFLNSPFPSECHHSSQLLDVAFLARQISIQHELLIVGTGISYLAGSFSRQQRATRAILRFELRLPVRTSATLDPIAHEVANTRIILPDIP